MSTEVTTRWQKVEVLRAARRRRALAELDYRRAVIDVIESGLEVAEVAARLRVPEAALEGVWMRCEGVRETPEGFSGASPVEIVQRYDVGLLTAEQVVGELSAWDYDGVREAEQVARLHGDVIPGAGGGMGEAGGSVEDVGVGVGEGEANQPVRMSGDRSAEAPGGPAPLPVVGAAADDHRWSQWLSAGAPAQVRDEDEDVSGNEPGRDVDAASSTARRWRPDPQGMQVDPDGEWAQVEDALQSGLLPQSLYARVQLAVNPGMVLPVEGPDAEGTSTQR